LLTEFNTSPFQCSSNTPQHRVQPASRATKALIYR
jgi:hypothetical protein